MARIEDNSKATLGSGPDAPEADGRLGLSGPTGPEPLRNAAGARAKTGPRINLTIADPTRIKAVRKPKPPGLPAEQRPDAEPGPGRPALERRRPHGPRSPLVWKTVPTDCLHSSWLRPSAPYDDEAIQSLVASITTAGWQHPILVRPHPVIARDYEIVAGELAYQAARFAGLEQVTVVICRLSDKRALECVLLEDVRRPDLMPFERAVGYGQLIRTFNYSLPLLTKLVGKSERQVIRSLLLLDSSTAARGARDKREAQPNGRRTSTIAPDAADRIVGRSAASRADAAPGSGEHGLGKEMAALDRHLSDALGLEVATTAQGAQGSLRISYASLEQLERLVRHLKAAGAQRAPEPTRPGLAA